MGRDGEPCKTSIMHQTVTWDPSKESEIYLPDQELKRLVLFAP